MKRTAFMITVACAITWGVNTTQAQQQSHEHHSSMPEHHAPPRTTEDTRRLVQFPDELRVHMLSNMRDHLLALSEIQHALATEQFEKAGEIAEQRLGMSSLKLHGAHEVAPYMPKAMAAIGNEMHHAASRFAIAAHNAEVVGNTKTALAALSEVTSQCVACHNGFRAQ